MSSMDFEDGTIEPEVRRDGNPDPDSALDIEMGTTGLHRAGGVIDEEFLTELKGDRGHRTYREMRDNEPTVGGLMFAVEMSLRGVQREVRPAEETDPDALAVAQFVDSCFDDMSHSWEDTLSEILSMLVHGYSPHEIVYKRRGGLVPGQPGASSKFDDGLIGWRKLPIRAQDTVESWLYDESGGVRGLVQVDPDGGGTAEIPIEKLLLFRTTSHKGNPEGRSILRNAYRPWYFKRRIEEFEAIGIERELAGLPVIHAPVEIFAKNATEQQKAMRTMLLKTVRNIRRDAQDGMLFPLAYDEDGHKMYEFELASTSGRRAIDTQVVIQRKMTEIALTVLADFILLGHENVGSFALSQDKTNLFASALDTYLASIADVFSRHAIPRLMLLNGIPLELAPRLTFSDVAAPTLDEIANYLDRLAATGMPLFPDERLESMLREKAGLPPAPTEGEEQTDAEAADAVPTRETQPTTREDVLDAFGLTDLGGGRIGVKAVDGMEPDPAANGSG